MRKFYFLVLGLLFFNGVKAQIVNIPNTNFKQLLLSNNTIAKNISGSYFKIDANSDGEIQVSEAQNVIELSFSDTGVAITSIVGITSFSNLTDLYCPANGISSMDLRGLTSLKKLNCFSNSLTSLNLQGLVNLTDLICSHNQLTSINLNGLANLTSIDCYDNKLTSLDLDGLVSLSYLDCSYNQLKTIDLSGIVIRYPVFNLNNNGLTSFTLKNGVLEQFVSFANNPNLQFVCVDESETIAIQNKIQQYGYTNCNVNSYCSFVPGGNYYIIQGNTKLDNNNNGCDVEDTNYPNLKFSITNGTISGSLIANTVGNYNIPVIAGTYTVTPVLENPSYFTVSPEVVNVTFPTESSPFTQDFCFTANGVHPDLEVIVLPINRARPGFDSSYKIIYKNKGNQTQSGAVKLTFDDAVLDFVSASPVVTTQSTNNLSWNFTDLKPFETREIDVTLNVNSPMETPAVNIDDILSYTATITSVQTDETPTDNTFALNQTVVGSYDPNDKTCLEGATIPPSAVGKYVHYLIRFENKGTAEAQNVVVKDMIDTSKFDVSSLVVTQGSHPFVTKISETNKVEFIFENINLPFDDATNDGYVAFKIKTKPSLVVGDSFSNTASIYFDYNFPIVTNTATTSVLQSLGTNDFEFDSYFSVYPNPAKNSLNLDIKKQIKLSSISIYNTLGQQILVIPNAQYTKQVDVSNLKTGNYFIKLISDKGSTIGKFIKS